MVAPEAETAPPAVPRRKWLKRVLLAIGGLTLLLILGLVGLRLYFSDAYFAALLQSTVKRELGRELRIGALRASLWSGTVALTDVALKNAATEFSDPDTLRVKKIVASAPLLQLALGGLAKLEGLRLDVQGLEALVERRAGAAGEETNLDDLLRKFFSGPPGSWPKRTGLERLAFDLNLDGGMVRFRDPARGLGESRIENLKLDASQTALGQPVHARLGLTLFTPQTPQGGRGDFVCSLRWIETDGSIAPAQVQDLAVKATLANLDLPFLTRHLGLQVELLDRTLESTLGQAVSGEFELSGVDLAHVELKSKLETAGMFSLWEKGIWKAGNLPARAELTGHGGWRDGALRFEDIVGRIELAQTRQTFQSPSAKRHLVLDLRFLQAGAAFPVFNVDLKSNLDDLFSTDIGALLQLKDRLGAQMEFKAKSYRDANGSWRVQGDLKTDQAYLVIEGVRQPASVEIGFDAKATPDATGQPDQAEVTLTCTTGSMRLQCLEPIRLQGLSAPARVSATGKLRLDLDGSRFCKEFQPLLAVFGLGGRLEERLEGELTLGGSPGAVKAEFTGTASRQKGAPEPLRLVAHGEYNGRAFAAAEGKPYLAFGARFEPPAGRSAKVELEGHAAATRDQHVTVVELCRLTGTSEALDAIVRRFGLYAAPFAGLPIAPSGTVDWKGRVQVLSARETSGAAASRDVELQGDLTFAGLKLSIPAAKADGAALDWTEGEAQLQWKSRTRTTGGRERLDLSDFRWTSGVGTLHGEAAGIDLALLAGASAAKPKALLDALLGARLSVQVSEKGWARLAEAGLVPSALPPLKELRFTLSGNPETKNFTLDPLHLHAQGFAASGIANFSAESLGVVLSAGPAGWAAALGAHLPQLRLEITAGPALAEHLARRKLLPPGLALQGMAKCKAVLDPQADRVRIEELVFEKSPPGSAVLELLKASAEVGTVSALLADPPGGLVAWINRASPEVRIAVARLAPAPLLDFLKAEGLAAGLCAQVKSGVYRVEVLEWRDLVVKAGAQPGRLDAAFALHAQFEHRPRSGSAAVLSAEPAAHAKGVMKTDPATPFRIVLRDERVDFEGALLLDDSDLFCSATKPWVYRKAAGAPCRLSVAGAAQNDGTVRLSALEIEGVPVSLKLQDLEYRTARDQFQVALKSMALTAPLVLTVKDLALDTARDLLKFSAQAAPLTAAQVAPYLALPDGWRMEGGLEETHSTYQGRWSAFTQGFRPTDLLTFRTGLKDLRLAVRAQDRAAAWTLSGPLEGDAFRLTSAGLNLAGESGPLGVAPVRQQLLLPLQVTGRDGRDLLEALSANGLPLLVRVPVEAKEPLNLAALLEAVNAFSGATPGAPAAPRGLDAIKELRVEIPTLNVPKLSAYGESVEGVRAPVRAQDGAGVVLDRLSVLLSSLAARVQGAEALVTQGRYEIALNPIRHEQSFQLTQVDLARVVPEPVTIPSHGPYRINGQVNLAGQLRGAGFAQAERRSWNGQWKAALPNLVVSKAGKEKETSNLGDSLTKLGVGLAGDLLGGKTGLGMKLYSQNFGLELSKLEFEPLEIEVSIREGKAFVERGRLRAKGANAGLSLAFEGVVDLAREEFAPHFQVWLADLPPRTQEIMGLPRFSAEWRKEILKDFAEGRFKFILTGPVRNFQDNRKDLLLQLNDLGDRLSRPEPAPKETGTPAPITSPGAGAAGPPPAKEPIPAGGLLAELTQGEATGGLREALNAGVKAAIGQLGRADGFFKNAQVKIPMPKSLAGLEKALRMVRLDALADDFVLTMNRAAEQAVPETLNIFAESVTQMTLEDAKAILGGADPVAATRFFQRTSAAKLTEKIRPIVAAATQKTGVTASFKKAVNAAGPLASFLGTDLDVDGYVTGKALDGMFQMIALEEQKIREHPAARTTELLKKVFGAK